MATRPERFSIDLAPDWLDRIAFLPERISPADVPYFKIDGRWNTELCRQRGQRIGYTSGGENRVVANLDYVALAITGSDLTQNHFLGLLSDVIDKNDVQGFELLRRAIL